MRITKDSVFSFCMYEVGRYQPSCLRMSKEQKGSPMKIQLFTMPPRIKFFGVRLTSYVRPRLPVSICQPAVGQIASRRGYAEDKSSKPATDPNQDTLGHVSEEAADIDRITGETPPNIEQGTPVQEVCLKARCFLKH